MSQTHDQDGRSGPGGAQSLDAHPPEYWRGLEEHFARQEGPTPEFPDGADSPPAGLSRRQFLSLLGASAALAGAAGCAPRPREKILPYPRAPEQVVPGEPLHYATATVMDGFAAGLLVRAREGRPVKVDGHPDHPATLGGASAQMIASILQLYDPHRARALTQRG